MKKKIKVALAGNPNVGKSTVFNQLTGLNQHTGNWPGKTVEKKIGYIEKDDYLIEIVDLPGTYSLTAQSLEELIAREFIVEEKPDIIVLVLDASLLERNLYLLSQILELHNNVILALNMMDILESKKYKLEIKMLEEKLKLPVIPMIASKGKGLNEFIEKIIEIYENDNIHPTKVKYSNLDETIKKIEELLPEKVQEYPKRWVAVKLLENDPIMIEICKKELKDWSKIQELIEKREDNPVRIATARYEWIKEILNGVLEKPKKQAILWTDKIDEYVTHPIWGLIIALILVVTIFYLTFSLNNLISDPLENLLDIIGKKLSILLAFLPEFPRRLITEGIWQGVATILSFTPLITIFFFFLAILEDTGYLARLAFITDRIMHSLGLHGKSFLPLVISFGCNVPGVMATRTLEDEKDRILLIIIDSFIPCVPRILVASFFLGVFFPKYAFLLLITLYIISFISIYISGKLLRKKVFKTSMNPLLMELPIYKIPNPKIVLLYIWDKLKSFLLRAGTVMAFLSGLTWILANIPSGNIENSLLSQIGKLFLPLVSPLGFNWQLTTALISGFVAKEASLSTLSAIYGHSGNELGNILLKDLSPITAYSFVIFQLLYIPCAATVATIYKETNSIKWTAFAIFYSLIYAYTFTFVLHYILIFFSSLL